MARVRQTARKRAVGAGKSRAKAAAVNAGAEAESETESESESESWLDKVDGFGQADAESEAPSPAAFCAPGAEPAAKLWSFSTVDNNLGEDSECEPEEYDKKVLQFEQAQRKRKEANAQKWSRMAGLAGRHSQVVPPIGRSYYCKRLRWLRVVHTPCRPTQRSRLPSSSPRAARGHCRHGSEGRRGRRRRKE